MCTVKTRQDLYAQIQQIEYDLEIMGEDFKGNRGVILEHEEKKAKLEEKLEEVD